ncbi:unnamed protein product [Symbiodinium sp. CCMP2592]|nr:unnamed protein product [Symbiodinium sp. CCMP2592]
MVVHVVFAAGILSTAAPWSAVLPEGARLVPVEYRPFCSSEPEAAVDFASTAALRLLSEALNLSASNTTYALAGHSAGGLPEPGLLGFARGGPEPGLQRNPRPGGELLAGARGGRAEGSIGEGDETNSVAVLSFEGSLMPCDVDGWAADWALSATPPKDEHWIRPALEDPGSQWTWFMARACCRSLMERCAADPPVHLRSIAQFLQLPEGPRFFYVAGAESKKRNDVVFPALKKASAGSPGRLELKEIPHAGHNMHRDAPKAVRTIFSEAFDSQAQNLV